MISEFIYKYYIDPIRYGQPYTIVDTLTYALILIFFVWLVYRLLIRCNISVDREFVYALIPWVVFGGLLRVVEDTGVITSDWHMLLITPIIFFVIFVIGIVALFLCWYAHRLSIISDYKKGFMACGGVLSLLSLLFLLYFGVVSPSATVDLSVAGIILLVATVTTVIIYLLLRYGLHWKYVSDRLYQLLIFGHMIDASATSFGIDLHSLKYVEQHVVGSALIDITGTAFVMFPLKLLVIIPGIYILELYRRENADAIWYLIILAMIMVGMAPGIRDMMRMVLYV